MRMRLSSVLSVLLCVLCVIGSAGAEEFEYPVNYEIATDVSNWEEMKAAAESGADFIIVTEDICLTRSDEAVVFKNAVVIRGDGNTPITIDGGSGTALFIIGAEDETATLQDPSVLENLILQNGYAADNANPYRPGCGGAVLVMGDLYALRCTFAGNQALSGGAVYTVGALTLIGCQLDGNTAQTDGGAVYVEDADAYLLESEMSKNTAQQYGGAVYASGENVMIYDTTISFNTAGVSGGAVYAMDGSVTPVTCEVDGNDPNNIVQGME